jgi:hypothetical protein
MKGEPRCTTIRRSDGRRCIWGAWHVVSCVFDDDEDPAPCHKRLPAVVRGVPTENWSWQAVVCGAEDAPRNSYYWKDVTCPDCWERAPADWRRWRERRGEAMP